jgi:hypothetical protein
MLNTPAGSRFPEDSERQMISFGTRKLAEYILKRLRCEERKVPHEGVIIRAVKEDSPFHSLNAQSQLLLLEAVIRQFFSVNTQAAMTQFYNCALEAIYSCIFYEVQREIIEAKRPSSRTARKDVYYAWEYWFDGNGKPLDMTNNNIDEWCSTIDKLAAKTVFDRNYAKQFEVGVVPDATEVSVQSAINFLENL